jgi:carbon storage regulator
MLVLSRQRNESIIINDNINVTILSRDGDQVKLGIRAPQDIAIFRQELWEAIRDQEKVATLLACSSDNEKFEELRELLINEVAKEEVNLPSPTV